MPVFVDVEEGTYNINAGEFADAVTEKTKAIMIAHTLGERTILAIFALLSIMSGE